MEAGKRFWRLLLNADSSRSEQPQLISGTTCHAYHATKGSNVLAIEKSMQLKESTGGMFGPGVYATTDPCRARCHGEFFYKLRFDPAKVKIANEADIWGNWRETADAIYKPDSLHKEGSSSCRDEFCIKGSCISQVTYLGKAPPEADTDVLQTRKVLANCDARSSLAVGAVVVGALLGWQAAAAGCGGRCSDRDS
eukprot:TRINITY_DN29434_c0_g1_i1.p2 TRINITY_DN29434_c0_g1~~TRINITY_DN29434_c0_g1_i1.p2  ORF type:complete len:208 (+),score=44.00 TRINITY_DN29434_c0_g1_i1:40-624(+)